LNRYSDDENDIGPHGRGGEARPGRQWPARLGEAIGVILGSFLWLALYYLAVGGWRLLGHLRGAF
jgi:hypothetical protein